MFLQAEMKSFQSKEHVMLYGKGRKKMKPLLTFRFVFHT